MGIYVHCVGTIGSNMFAKWKNGVRPNFNYPRSGRGAWEDVNEPWLEMRHEWIEIGGVENGITRLHWVPSG